MLPSAQQGHSPAAQAVLTAGQESRGRDAIPSEGDGNSAVLSTLDSEGRSLSTQVQQNSRLGSKRHAHCPKSQSPRPLAHTVMRGIRHSYPVPSGEHRTHTNTPQHTQSSKPQTHKSRLYGFLNRFTFISNEQHRVCERHKSSHNTSGACWTKSAATAAVAPSEIPLFGDELKLSVGLGQ